MKRRNVFQGVLAALFTGLVMPLKGKAWDVETIPSGDDLQKGIAALRNIVEIQTSDGNWNSSPYMQGMANGLIFALSLFERGRPQYLDPPDKWLSGEQSWTTEGAVKRLSDAFRIDPNFAWGWHCNIACMVHDSGCEDWAIANEAARRFMKLAFGVEGYES